MINKQWAGSRGTKLARRVLRAGLGGNRCDWVAGISLPLVVRRRMVVADDGCWALGGTTEHVYHFFYITS